MRWLDVLPRAVAVAALAGLLVAPRTSHATVAEQRARLPPPAKCKDEVEGIWKAHHYRDRYKVWDLFTLEVRRKPGNKHELEGSIRNQTWGAGADRQVPGTCEGLTHHYKVSMPATGTIGDNGAIAFGSTTYKMDAEICGKLTDRGGTYYPDSFTGTIDPELQEFQSVNNDGGAMVNEPMVFRRIKCFETEDGEPPKPQIDPPPFMPPQDGC